jgi:hypothetical protein
MVHLKSLLLDLKESLLDVLLNLGNGLLLLLQLIDQIIKFLLQNLVLSSGVQVVQLDSGDLV